LAALAYTQGKKHRTQIIWLGKEKKRCYQT
jgi:hypothetical protein